jgi:uncharacterized membrane protein
MTRTMLVQVLANYTGVVLANIPESLTNTCFVLCGLSDKTTAN